MKVMKMLGLAALIASSSLTQAAPAAPAAATAKPNVVTVGHVKAVNTLMAAMQAEKMMRTIAGQSRYADEAQRTAVFVKLERVPPAQIYERMAYPVAHFLSQETATEMARFYASRYGKNVVYQMYNSKAGMYPEPAPIATPAEQKDMKRPEFLKAQKEMAAADDAIRHEAFVLLQAISKN